jgi:hypothetical protein
MSKPNLDVDQSFKKELQKDIKKRGRYEYWDFRLAHFFIWLSILASFTSWIAIAAGLAETKRETIWLAIISGIPGLAVVVEKTFDFARRAVWRTMYKIDMQKLNDKVKHGKIDIYSASQELRKIAKRNELAFLKIGFFSQDKVNSKNSENDKINYNKDDKSEQSDQNVDKTMDAEEDEKKAN